MTLYELLYIIPTPFTENDIPLIQEKTVNLIKDLGGLIKKTENFGNRKLAYEIKHVKRGFYISHLFTLEPNQLKNLEKKLELMPEILRFLICLAPRVKEKKPSVKKEETKKIDLKTLNESIDQLLDEVN